MTTLTIMVGPSGAGKSTWLNTMHARSMGIKPRHVISSDEIREDMCGDFKDQSRNREVFRAVHELTHCRLANGLDTVVDSTSIRAKDRISLVNIGRNYDANVRYVVIDRPLEEKRKTGEWRNEISNFDLIGRHHETMQSEIGNILHGDDDPLIIVHDFRTMDQGKLPR